MEPVKRLKFILFILELATMLYFIPLLIYLAEYSFDLPGIGFFVGVLVVVHYYVIRWYYDRGSLVYFGLSMIIGALGSGITWFSGGFQDLFFPAQYLFEFGKLILPNHAFNELTPLFYYYVFLTGIVYTSIGRYILKIVCSFCDLRICGTEKRTKREIDEHLAG